MPGETTVPVSLLDSIPLDAFLQLYEQCTPGTMVAAMHASGILRDAFAVNVSLRLLFINAIVGDAKHDNPNVQASGKSDFFPHRDLLQRADGVAEFEKNDHTRGRTIGDFLSWLESPTFLQTKDCLNQSRFRHFLVAGNCLSHRRNGPPGCSEL